MRGVRFVTPVLMMHMQNGTNGIQCGVREHFDARRAEYEST
jgi:hypothetical protein